MGSKNNPGVYDCYNNAEPDEPMFVLLARDPLAPMLVSLWASMRETMEDGVAKSQTTLRKVAEARGCSIEMRRWWRARNKIVPAETRLEAVKRLQDEIAARYYKLQVLVAGRPDKAVTVPVCGAEVGTVSSPPTPPQGGGGACPVPGAPAGSSVITLTEHV
jgi:hypothetical protein